jgi:PA14 domain
MRFPLCYGSLLLLLLLRVALPAAAQAVVSDQFSNGKAVGWQTTGTWAVADKAYRSGPETATAFRTVPDWPSATYSARVTPAANGEAGLVFRAATAADSTRGYYVTLDAGADRVRLYWLGRQPRAITSAPFVLQGGTAYRLRVQARQSHLDVFVDDEPVLSVVDTLYRKGTLAGLKATSGAATFDDFEAKELKLPALPTYDWSGVRGAVFVPTTAVNELDEWQNFDEATNERELFWAKVYGMNMVRVYLHFLAWDQDRTKFLRDIETFLTIADRHGIQTEFVFFDDVWNPYPKAGPQAPPAKGVHNSRWLQGPGNAIKDDYARYRPRLKAYVQDVVNAHRADKRVAFWEAYNEPGNSQKGLYMDVTHYLLNDSRIWIKQTGTPIPVVSSASPRTGSTDQFARFESWVGGPYSDFYTFHSYDDKYTGARGPQVLNTECMNRKDQNIPGIAREFGGQRTGYLMWELGIGRDNCRYQWETPAGSPEPTVPFHGMVYPDGHPWDTLDVAAVRGTLADLPVFNVTYFSRPDFTGEKKRSFTPRIDFDLGDEDGTGSPDASASLPKDHFSVRWTGKVVAPQNGAYTFSADTDHAVRVWLDGKEIVTKTAAGRATATGTAPLVAGQAYALRVEYAHATGPASLHLRWQGPGVAATWLPGRR